MVVRSYSDKPCAVCGASFTPGSGGALYCVDCRPAAERAKKAERYAANPEKYRELARARYVANLDRERASNAAWRAANLDRVRSYQLEHLYNISVGEYDAMFQAQGGGCAICGRPPQARRLHIDHDHVTLLVRGLLCDGCNRRIVGRVRHGDILRRAADYLDNPPAVAIIGERFTPKRKRKKRNPKAVAT